MNEKLNEIKQEWLEYMQEFETSEYMDIDKHTNMALNVGVLLAHIDELNNESKS